MRSNLALEFDKEISSVLKVMRKTIASQDTNSIAVQETLKLLGSLPFWCEDNTLHERNKDYRDVHCCVTHTVGLPRHPATDQEMPLTPYQVEFANEIISSTKPPPPVNGKQKRYNNELDKFLHRHHFFHVLKGRQMGFTEIVLRLIQFFCFSRYAGNNVGIIAATNGNLAKKDLRRFARLYKNIPIVVTQWIKNNTMMLANDIVVEAFKANEEAITGDTRYKCIFMDEAGKWKLIDDTPVFNSVEPIVRASGGDLFLVSTPKGPIKMFYKIVDKKIKEYKQLKYDIWRSLGNLYNKSEIDEMLASETSDAEQEYLCKFTTAEDAIYGEITDDDRGTGWGTWDQKINKAEDDNYDEDIADWNEIHEDEEE